MSTDQDPLADGGGGQTDDGFVPAPSFIVRAGEGEGVGLGRIVLPGGPSGGLFSLLEITGRPGVTVPAHLHRDADEVFFMLEGELIVRTAEGEATIRPGDAAFVPRGAWHAQRNLGVGAVRWLTLFSPAGMEGYFAERAHLVLAARAAGGDGPRDYAGIDPDVHTELRRRFGIVITDD